MLLASLALATVQPLLAPTPLLAAPVLAAPTPCNPDAMKSIGCVAQARVATRSPSARDEELAAAN